MNGFTALSVSSPTNLALLLLGCTILYKYIVYPLLLSPLSKVPAAHPLCHITDGVSDYLTKRERDLDWLVTAHRKKGPIVRTGPATVNVNLASALSQIYTSLDKHPFYAQFTFYNGTPNTFTTVAHKPHAAIKKLLSPVFSSSYLQRSDDLRTICQTIIDDRLRSMLAHFADTHRPVNVFQLFLFLGIDFYTAYALGLDDAPRLAENQGHEEKPYETCDASNIYESHDLRDFDWIPEDECLALCRTAMQRVTGQVSSSPLQATRPVVFEKIYTGLVSTDQRSPDPKAVLRRCASEIRDHIIAASEPTATTLTYATHHISQCPSLQARLRQELTDAADPYQAPFLTAILTETLRLHAASPARQPRVAPTPAGLTLLGHHIPAGTTVSAASYVLHRNASVFPDPESFRPERWLKNEDDDNASEQKRWFWAFGSGSRMCIGEHLAWILMRGVLVEIYGRPGSLQTQVVDDKGVEQRKAFIATPKARRLILEFTRVVGK